MPHNKTRVYLALYFRPKHGNFHYAILTTPKKPQSGVKDSWRLHAADRLVPKEEPELQAARDAGDPTAYVKWLYIRDHIIAGDKTSLMSPLACVALLGKTQMTCLELADLLDRVEIVQGDKTWNCVSWALAAVRLMTQEGVISVPPVPIEDLSATAETMAKAFLALPYEKRQALPIPTCNSAGAPLVSELV